ncbi:cytochrome P450 1A1-like, partial [Saccoglossus kowalevskii]
TDTSTHALLWAVLYLSLLEDIQQCCFDEISSRMENYTAPCWRDRTILPYLDAFILETLPFSTTVYVDLKAVSEDTQLCGYTVTNWWSVHHDEKTWANPEEFNPQRFLN